MEAAMMQAAQLAAEAAARDAAQNGGGGNENNDEDLPVMMDMMNDSSSSFMTDSSEQMLGQMGLLRALESNTDFDGDGGQHQYQQQQQQQQQYQQRQAQHHYGGLGGRDNNINMLSQEMSMMGVDPNDPDSVQMFLQILQQREQQEEHERQQAGMNARPNEHYMTIAQNGMILEATKTVTGFPPDSLLMTSAYDAVYEDDLPGFLAIKSHFWDKGNPDVETYIRRRSVEGDWIWLVTKAVSYVEQPIPGIILIERRVESAQQREYENYYDDDDDDDDDEHASPSSVPYYDVNWKEGPSALVIGSEGNGISSEIRTDLMRKKTMTTTPINIRATHIPMGTGIESLNCAVCGSVILFEYSRQCARNLSPTAPTFDIS
mmetsp:Transcript_24323/g.27223  ORF Transcript_24323/g.27223 Transcript_24323/m.27223 type:complete len:375 (+) Transcript_24323:356-1480(+)